MGGQEGHRDSPGLHKMCSGMGGARRGWEAHGLETTPLGSRAPSVPSVTTRLPREGKCFCPHVLGPKQGSSFLAVSL